MSIESILAPVNLVLLMVLLALMIRNGRKKVILQDRNPTPDIET